MIFFNKKIHTKYQALTFKTKKKAFFLQKKFAGIKKSCTFATAMMK